MLSFENNASLVSCFYSADFLALLESFEVHLGWVSYHGRMSHNTIKYMSVDIISILLNYENIQHTLIVTVATNVFKRFLCNFCEIASFD